MTNEQKLTLASRMSAVQDILTMMLLGLETNVKQDSEGERIIYEVQNRSAELMHVLNQSTGDAVHVHPEVRPLARAVNDSLAVLQGIVASLGAVADESDTKDIERQLAMLDEIDSITRAAVTAGDYLVLHMSRAYNLRDKLRRQQAVFDSTSG